MSFSSSLRGGRREGGQDNKRRGGKPHTHCKRSKTTTPKEGKERKKSKWIQFLLSLFHSPYSPIPFAPSFPPFQILSNKSSQLNPMPRLNLLPKDVMHEPVLPYQRQSDKPLRGDLDGIHWSAPAGYILDLYTSGASEVCEKEWEINKINKIKRNAKERKSCYRSFHP